MNLMDGKAWFRSAGYGMMIHFGLYSLLGGEYRGKQTEQIGEWIQSYFRIPNEEYHQLAKVFNPLYFDADEWVSIAKAAGMKYIVVTSKHHEGFALFKSADPFNVVDATPFGRDIIKELAEACQRQGIRLGLYYSQAIDWSSPNAVGYGREKNCGCMDWGNTWDFAQQPHDYQQLFEEKIKPQVREILTNYGELCPIWFDTPDGIPEACSQELYQMVRHYQPGCLVNSRLGNGIFDYESSGDNEIPQTDKHDHLFETCATLNDTWGYKSFDQNWKSPETVVRTLHHVNRLGANYLLNIGPDALGRIPARAEQILLAAGQMLRQEM